MNCQAWHFCNCIIKRIGYKDTNWEVFLDLLLCCYFKHDMTHRSEASFGSRKQLKVETAATQLPHDMFVPFFKQFLNNILNGLK